MQISRHSSVRQNPECGNYELLSLLGQGGFAEVYLGRHIYLHTTAAVKIQSELTTADGYRFLEEARLLAQLRHPHIVRVLDFGLEGDEPFLVMEYAPHGTMRQRYKGSRLAPGVVLRYAEQAAQALNYIHSLGLVHRDIKPENLLLGPDNELLLSDFGITIALHEVASAQIPSGTAFYMAPEQIEGRPCLASDQYALGVVVYELLCGKKPFHGTLDQIIYQHCFVEPPALCQHVRAIPPAVEDVVARALAKDPRERFESVQAFAAALRKAYEGKHSVRSVYDLTQQLQSHLLLKEPERRSGLLERDQGRAGREETDAIQRRTASKEIATCYGVDLLLEAALGCLLATLNVTPFLLSLLLSLSLLLPLGAALARRNSLLFFLTASLAVAAAVLALLFHALITFVVVFTILLLFSLLTALAVSVNDM